MSRGANSGRTHLEMPESKQRNIVEADLRIHVAACGRVTYLYKAYSRETNKGSFVPDALGTGHNLNAVTMRYLLWSCWTLLMIPALNSLSV